MPRPKVYSTFEEYRKVWRNQNPEKVALQNKRAEPRQRAWRFRTEYKINLAKYNEMFEKQNGLCAICEKPQSDFKYRFAVDHDHKTGQVRGLLCFTCNTRLAVVEDSLFMLKAKDYLGGYSNSI